MSTCFERYFVKPFFRFSKCGYLSVYQNLYANNVVCCLHVKSYVRGALVSSLPSLGPANQKEELKRPLKTCMNGRLPWTLSPSGKILCTSIRQQHINTVSSAFGTHARKMDEKRCKEEQEGLDVSMRTYSFLPQRKQRCQQHRP